MKWGEIHQADTSEIETEIFGLSHCEIGATLLVRWNIPKEIIIPVRFHHDPTGAPSHQKLVRILYFAERISTFLLSEGEQKRLNEFYSEDSMWFKMSSDFPEMNLMDDEKKFTALKNELMKLMIVR